MRTFVALVAAVVLAVATGCSWAGEVQELPDGTRVLVSGPTGGGEDAAGGGALRDVDGCLGLGRTVAVFPHGTEVADGDDPALVLPDGQRVSMGDRLVGGGGYHDATSLHSPVPRVPEECRGAGKVFVMATVEPG